MKFSIFLTCFLCLLSPASIAGDFLSKDRAEINKSNNWHVFNGNIELGAPEERVPGFIMLSSFEPKVAAKNVSKNYYPVTKEEANGNKYLLVKGYKGLPEYNLYCNKFPLNKDGEVEISFRTKMLADENGDFQKSRPVILDFRCRNDNVHYGTVKQRYPVLKSKHFRPTKEWKTFKYKIKVVGGFDYRIKFRRDAGNPYNHFNGLCFDDISIKYIEKAAKEVTELAIIPDRLISAYYKGEKAVFKVNAIIHGSKDSEKIRLYVREDYSNKVFETINLTLKRQKKISSSKYLYAGSFALKNKRYGSYSMLAERNNKLVFSMGGAFVTLHKLATKASDLQRKLGGHFRPGGQFQLLSRFDMIPMKTSLGLEAEAKVFALSGLRHAMYAFDMKKVQAQIDKLDFTLSDAEIAVLEKYNIEVIGCFGGWWIRQEQKVYKGKKYGKQLPNWFFDKKFTKSRPKSIKRGSDVQVPSLDVWKFHVDGIAERYSKRINKWMALVEPQWVLLPKEYLAFQKIAYKKTKAVNPNSYFIGGDATSDVGYNLTGWLQKLSKLGFEKYLDAASFNPYRSSTDYINGVRFRYSNLIKRIRKSVKNGTALWEEELYHISNTKRKQLQGSQNIFSAGDAQRHYLLGLMNGLKGITAISSTLGGALYKTPYTLTDTCAGINTMSYFLSGKSEFETIPVSNKLIRAGIFYNKSKTDCAAVIWALQPKGSSMLLPGTAGIKCFDNFGNEIKTQKTMPLQLDPMFLTGNYKTLKNLINKSAYSMGVPIKLRARSFGNSRTFYEAQNISGRNNIIFLDMDGKTPKIRLRFGDYDYQAFSIPVKTKKYKASLQGEVVKKMENIEHIADSGSLVIPASAVNPLTLSSKNGNIIKLWTEKDKLWIKAEIKDNEITAAADNALYNGDALEVFIDSTPFIRMDIDEALKASKELKVSQYIFAAVPSKSGKSLMALNKSNNLDISNSKAVSTTKKNSSGYSMTASIPLSKIAPLPGNGNIIGINFELCRRDGSKKLSKDYFSKSKRPSHQYRFHYKLAKLKGVRPNLIKNGDCENGFKNWSCYQNRLLKTKNMFAVTDAFAGKKAIKIITEEKPSWGTKHKRGIVSCNTSVKAGKYILTFFAKANKIEKMKINLSNAKGVVFQKNEIPVSSHWTKYKLHLTVKKDSPKRRINFSCLSLRKDSGAYFIIDNVQLIKQ